MLYLIFLLRLCAQNLKQNSIKAKVQLFTKALTFILENAGLQSNLGHDVLKVGVYRSTIL